MKNAVTGSHVNVRGNLDTTLAQRMTIDADGMVIVMGLLSNLYSNGNEAVVREYSCNARDSHVEAGHDKPIEVSLPTALNPQFIVQDYGVGLSREQIFDVYAKYGASTKRDSNEQIGAFGIGAKSAFTVGNQFTVTGVKDGLKTIVMFAKRNDGTPTVQELFHGETDEPNGVMVDVGVENVSAVQTAATKIFSCWRPGTVLVDGAKPDTMWDNTEKLAEGVYVDWQSGATRYDAASHFKLVMGGVPYNIPSALWGELSNKARTFYESSRSTTITYVLDVPIGRVDITPNREELHITPRTRSTVGRLVELAADSLQAWITTKLDGATSLWDAAAVYRQLITRLNYRADPKMIYWNGTSLGDAQVVLKRPTYTLDRKTYVTNTGRDYRTMAGDAWYVKIDNQLGYYNDVLFVTNVPDDKLNIVRSYSKLNLLDEGKKILVTLAEPGFRQGWFSVGKGADHDDISVIDFQAFWDKGKKLRKAQSGNGSRSKTKYNTFAKGDTYRQQRNVDEIEDLGNALVAVSHTFIVDVGNKVHQEVMDKQDVIFVKLTSQQSVDVFKRAFPNAVDAFALVKDYATKIVTNLSKADERILKADALSDTVNSTALDYVTKHRSRITNPGLLKYVNDYNAGVTLTQADRIRLSYLQDAYSTARVGNPFEAGAKDDYFRKQFPLLLIGLRNIWGSEQILGSTKNVNDALIDYINNMPAV